MIVVGLFFGVLVLTMLVWYLVQKRRLVKDQQKPMSTPWMKEQSYPRSGDRRGSE